MPVMRLNHAVLYVRDAQRSAAFYEEVLGFVRLTELPRAVFMRAPGLDQRPRPGTLRRR